MKFERSGSVGGPSSAIGIMRFFDVDMGGPKISPESILVATAILIVIIIALQLMS